MLIGATKHAIGKLAHIPDMLEPRVINELLQLIETPSRPVFRLARSLASLAQVPARALHRLMALCPIEKALRETTANVALDPRSQETLVGMALLLHDSGGQHADILLPTLLGALRVVASADGQVACAAGDGIQLKPQVFVDLLVTLLLGTDLGAANAQHDAIAATQQLTQTVTSRRLRFPHPSSDWLGTLPGSSLHS